VSYDRPHAVLRNADVEVLRYFASSTQNWTGTSGKATKYWWILAASWKRWSSSGLTSSGANVAFTLPGKVGVHSSYVGRTSSSRISVTNAATKGNGVAEPFDCFTCCVPKRSLVVLSLHPLDACQQMELSCYDVL